MKNFVAAVLVCILCMSMFAVVSALENSNAQTSESEGNTPSEFLNFLHKNVNPDHCMFTMGEAMTPKQAKELKEVSQTVTANCTSDSEKAYALYNYVMDTLQYGTPSKQVPNNTIAWMYEAHNHGVGECEQYARLLNILLRYADIPAYLITCKVNGGSHGFTAAHYDGKWHYMDATFGDSTDRDKYFDMSKDSILDKYTRIVSGEEIYYDGIEYMIMNDNVQYYAQTYLGLDSAKTITVHGEIYGLNAVLRTVKNDNTLCSLQKVIIADDVTDMGEMKFFKVNTLQTAEISGALKKIPENMFSSCKNLKKVVLHEGIQEIDDGAFWQCGIEKINIPSTVKTIGASAFTGCPNLKEAVINEGVQSIGKHGFEACEALQTVHFPSTLIQNIGTQCFYNCVNLKDLYFNGTVAEFFTMVEEETYFFYSFMGEDFNGNKVPATDRIYMTVHCLKDDKVFEYNVGQNNHEQEKEPEPPEDPYRTDKIIKPDGPKTMKNFKKNVAVSLSDFTDLDEDAWYANEVKAVIESGIMMGKGDGIFAPDDNISGAEIVKMFTMTSYIYNGGNGKDTFQSYISWYFPYWEYAFKNIRNIVENAVIEYHNLEKPATREQMAYLFAKALPQEELAAVKDVTSIPDYSKKEKIYSDIISLYNAGVLVGSDEKGSLLPDANITRAEAAVILARVIFPQFRVQ